MKPYVPHKQTAQYGRSKIHEAQDKTVTHLSGFLLENRAQRKEQECARDGHSQRHQDPLQYSIRNYPQKLMQRN